jgi:hypothetical protein
LHLVNRQVLYVRRENTKLVSSLLRNIDIAVDPISMLETVFEVRPIGFQGHVLAGESLTQGFTSDGTDEVEWAVHRVIRINRFGERRVGTRQQGSSNITRQEAKGKLKIDFAESHPV